uniref:SCP domain-containing protein n=1 Tax=Mesocestoides corti TaxID=53468 RepID=A0A5K3FK42_MESCO
SELETTAQNFLANCSSTGLDQSSLPADIFDFGNAYNNKGPMYVDMLTFYASEKKYYNYDQNQCTGPCRYYKVMTLATSNAVGCAQNNCTRQGETSESYLTVCLFKVNGGNADERPYKRGESCSECPDGFACHRKQCFDPPPPTTSVSTILSPVSIVNMLIFALCLHT